MPGFLISIGRSLLNWMRPSSPVPARGTPPLQPDLPTGSQTLTAQREDGKMGRGRRTRARTRTLSSETEERPAKTRRASTTDVPKVSTGKATEASSKKGKIPGEANFISNQMAHRYQQKVDENMKKDDRGTEKVNVAFKHANRLVSDEGRRSDSLRLAKDAAGLSQVSSDDVRRHYSKVKKAIAHSCRKVGSGKRVGKFGNTYIYDCVPSPSTPAEVPDVKFSKKNIFRKEEEKKSHKVKCSCEGINCSVNCDCVRFTINAGKAFLFERLVIRTEGESFFTAGIVACGPECGCEGKCSIGIVQLNDLDLVEIFRRDEILGFGLRAKTNIAPGQIVLEFVGHIVDSKEREESTIYAFQVAAEKDDECQQNLLLQAGVRNPKCQDIYIEPTKEGNAGRFVNTSERPNLFPIRIWSNDVSPYKVRMFFVSERPIRAGEELFVSYGESYQEDHLSDVSCRCQTDHCENSDALKGFSLEQKIDYILEQSQEINNWLEKDGMDLRSIIRSWTTTKQEIFVLILRALLNRCLFYDSRTKAAAIAAFNQLFFDVTQKVIVENDFMCSPEQLEKRQKFTPINEE